MSIVGTVTDMISRSKYNDSQKRHIIERYDKAKSLIQQSKNSHQPLHDKKVEPEKLERCKAEIRQQAQIEQRRQLIVLISIGSTLVALLLTGAILLL